MGRKRAQRTQEGETMVVVVRVFIAVTLIASTTALAVEQTNYKPPRTADGHPDLQGFWTNSSVTDLERPAHIAKLVLTSEEAAAIVERDELVERVKKDAVPANPQTGLLDGSDLLAGRGYNAFWIDPGLQLGRVKGEYRSSWIVDPQNGRIPYSDVGRAHAAAMRKREQSFDGPEVRPLGDRCLATTGRVGPPMVNGLYNNHYEIIQTSTHVVILSEMVQHARVIRIGGKHVPDAINPMFGDAIGRWDGDTLVVENTNFHQMHHEHAHPAFLSANAKVVERFTRYSKDQIFYEYTVTDPTLYTQPWRGESSLNATPERLFEYACHEGNYAMHGILMGGREQEKRATPGSSH
jgi:hypothetical protein